MKGPIASVEHSSVLSPALVAAARTVALSTQRPLLVTLEELSGLDSDGFTHSLSVLFAYPFFPMRRLQEHDPALGTVSFTECVRRHCAVVQQAGELFIVIADPFNEDLISWAATACSDYFEIGLASHADIEAWLRLQEQTLLAMGQLNLESGETHDSDGVAEISLANISNDASAAVRLVNSTLYDALKAKASDIHLECDVSSLNIKYRIDGVLVSAGTMPTRQLAEQAVSRIKVMADLDIGERRVPQDGRFKVKVNGREIDFRVSIMPNIFGEDVVLRLLDRRALTEEAQTLNLDTLGLDSHASDGIRQLAARPHGMLLVTGPTGSGKTTTLYAAITEINKGEDKIVTIEDPVEYRLPRVLQIPVNEKKGLTFARGLRSILRHDPDKIMIGEIRDDETAQIAVQASLTGHLVFTTVHANSVFDVLGRFLHMGVEPYSLAAALNGVVAQRLLRLVCPHCAANYLPSSDDLKDCGLMEGESTGWVFRRGHGCGHCRGSGYSGRRAVAEVLILNDLMRELIASRAPVAQLKNEASKRGFVPLREVARAMVRAGETTVTELARVSN